MEHEEALQARQFGIWEHWMHVRFGSATGLAGENIIRYAEVKKLPGEHVVAQFPFS